MSPSPKAGLTRREALKAAAAATAAASCGTGGDSGEAASGPGSIETIIIVMMENRSFDHWLGARKLLEGAAEEGLTATMSNNTAAGVVVTPFAETAPCPSDPPHGWTSCHDQWNEGLNDGFVSEYAARNGTDGSGVMAYQTRETTPISWALADSFGVCDQYFCSVMGPTWPNRFYAHMASSEGKQDNSLPDGGGFTEMNIWRALSAAGVDWAYYYSDLPILGLMADTWDDNRVGMIEDFYQKAEAGTLPPVVWVDPAFSYNDNHPPHHPGLGELFLASIYEALAASPQWERCLLIVTYDEHGGFFDHVPPGACDDDRADEGFDQLGFRVPTLLIGPWVKQGAISTTFDHTSWLKMVCETHGITPWNTRLEWATSIAAGIDQDRLARNEPLPAVALPAFDFDPETVGDECFYGQTLPRPLQALRDHCEAQGLPYRLADRGAVVGPFVRQWKRRGLVS